MIVESDKAERRETYVTPSVLNKSAEVHPSQTSMESEVRGQAEFEAWN